MPWTKIPSVWPFGKKRELPGVEQQPDGRISFTLTDEEKAYIDGFLDMIAKEAHASSQETKEEGAWYVPADFKDAAAAWQLIDYAKLQVKLADADEADKELCFRKALAAAAKAYRFHPLPIYLFDVGCILDMLGDPDSAQISFRSFLELQRDFKVSELDKIFLKQRNVESALRQARERVAQ